MTTLLVAAAAAIVLSSSVAYGMMWNHPGGYGQGQQASSQLQSSGYHPPGITGWGYSGYGYPGGMMTGAHGWMMSNGGMMGGYYGYPGASGNYSGNGQGTGRPLVVIADYLFYPNSITVPKGTTVTWVNMDFVQHTVTSGTEQSPVALFDSRELNHMQSFSYTFSTPGTYTYYCDVHPDMVGTVTVTA